MEFFPFLEFEKMCQYIKKKFFFSCEQRSQSKSTRLDGVSSSPTEVSSYVSAETSYAENCWVISGLFLSTLTAKSRTFWKRALTSGDYS